MLRVRFERALKQMRKHTDLFTVPAYLQFIPSGNFVVDDARRGGIVSQTRHPYVAECKHRRSVRIAGVTLILAAMHASRYANRQSSVL